MVERPLNGNKTTQWLQECLMAERPLANDRERLLNDKMTRALSGGNVGAHGDVNNGTKKVPTRVHSGASSGTRRC